LPSAYPPTQLPLASQVSLALGQQPFSHAVPLAQQVWPVPVAVVKVAQVVPAGQQPPGPQVCVGGQQRPLPVQTSVLFGQQTRGPLGLKPGQAVPLAQHVWEVVVPSVTVAQVVPAWQQPPLPHRCSGGQQLPSAVQTSVLFGQQTPASSEPGQALVPAQQVYAVALPLVKATQPVPAGQGPPVAPHRQ